MPILFFFSGKFVVIGTVLLYIYYDNLYIHWGHPLDITLVAKFLMVDRLKSMATVAITQSPKFLANHDIYELLYIMGKRNRDIVTLHS